MHYLHTVHEMYACSAGGVCLSGYFNSRTAGLIFMKFNVDIVARMWRLYKTGIGLTTGFIGSHTVTHNYSVYTLTAHYSSLQHLPSLLTVSSLVACLPIPHDPFAFRTNLKLCNYSLNTAASL
jgi:hypothetical protein